MIRRPPRSPLFPYPPLFRPPGSLRRLPPLGGRLPGGQRLCQRRRAGGCRGGRAGGAGIAAALQGDRKSTRLNSSHPVKSYAVFCLEKKKKKTSISRI